MIEKKTERRMKLGTMDSFSIRSNIHKLECELVDACDNYKISKSES